MAKKQTGSETKEVSRSQHIKAYLKKHRNAGPKEVVEALAKQGITVKTGLVSNIKYAATQKGQTKTIRKKLPVKKSSVRSSGGRLSASDLIAAKKFVDSVGGVANAKQAIVLLEELR